MAMHVWRLFVPVLTVPMPCCGSRKQGQHAPTHSFPRPYPLPPPTLPRTPNPALSNRRQAAPTRTQQLSHPCPPLLPQSLRPSKPSHSWRPAPPAPASAQSPTTYQTDIPFLPSPTVPPLPTNTVQQIKLASQHGANHQRQSTPSPTTGRFDLHRGLLHLCRHHLVRLCGDSRHSLPTASF